MQSMNNLVEVSSTDSTPSEGLLYKSDGNARRKIKTKRLRETVGVAKA